MITTTRLELICIVVRIEALIYRCSVLYFMVIINIGLVAKEYVRAVKLSTTNKITIGFQELLFSMIKNEQGICTTMRVQFHEFSLFLHGLIKIR